MTEAAGALLWDLDGTLVDSRADLAAAGNHARAQLGLDPLPVDTVGSYVGDGVGKLVERLCPGIDQAAYRCARQAFDDYYHAHCLEQTGCYPGVFDAVVACAAAGWRQAVVTNKATGFSRRILEHCRLADYFIFIYGGDIGPRKPDPAAVRAVLAGLAVPAERAWMIGDHRTDLQVAAAAGLRSIHCTYGFGRRDGEPATHSCRQASEIPSLVGADRMTSADQAAEEP